MYALKVMNLNDYISHTHITQEISLTDDTTWEIPSMTISEKTNLIGLSVVWSCDTALVENQERVCVL